MSLQVSVKSPSPDKPNNVSALAPFEIPRRVISARPLVIMAAFELLPNCLPSMIPQAIAKTFLTAPPIWAPIISRDL